MSMSFHPAGTGVAPCGRASPRRHRSALGNHLQGSRVDAVALSGGPGPVVEDVAEVAAAAPADDLGADHPMAGIGAQLHRLQVGGLVEARPAGARVELGVRSEELRAAAGAVVRARLMALPVPSAERRLGAPLAEDGVPPGAEPLPPFGIAQGNGTGALGHGRSSGYGFAPSASPRKPRARASGPSILTSPMPTTSSRPGRW